MAKGSSGTLNLNYTLDEKGRVGVPSVLREKTTDLYLRLVPSSAVHLEVMPYDMFEDLVEGELSALRTGDYLRDSVINSQLRAFATPVSLDSANRLMLPEQLKTEAGIIKNVKYVPKGRLVFELWGEERYLEFFRSLVELNKAVEQGVRNEMIRQSEMKGKGYFLELSSFGQAAALKEMDGETE